MSKKTTPPSSINTTDNTPKAETATTTSNSTKSSLLGQKMSKYGQTWYTKIRGLTQTQKQILAILIVFLVIIILIFANRFIFNQKFRRRVLGRESSTQEQQPTVASGNVEEYLNKLRTSLATTEPEEFIAEKVSLEDLNIYPTPWVERYFSETERKNSLISGPGGDADSDGLSNQQEYYLGSHPKNKYTLCGSNQGEDKCQKTDKDNYDSGINPLSGIKIEEQASFTITRLDKKLIQEIQDSFTNASQSGVDFPSVYQESRKIDLTNELQAINVKEQEDNRDSVLQYLDTRIKILGEFSEDDALSSFTQIYKLIDPESLKILRQNYQNILQKLQDSVVPKSYVPSHRATILTLQKTVELIDLRIEGLSKATVETPEFKNTSQKKAQEMIWAFRKLNEESKVFEQN